jgi:hypothetical protein
VEALATEDMNAEVLPELIRLFLWGYHLFPTVAKAAERFVATRQLAGRTVDLIW